MKWNNYEKLQRIQHYFSNIKSELNFNMQRVGFLKENLLIFGIIIYLIDLLLHFKIKKINPCWKNTIQAIPHYES